MSSCSRRPSHARRGTRPCRSPSLHAPVGASPHPGGCGRRTGRDVPPGFGRGLPGTVAAVRGPQVTWEEVLTQVINESHVVTGDQLSVMVDRAVRPLGLTAEVLAVDLAQRVLTPVRPR